MTVATATISSNCEAYGASINYAPTCAPVQIREVNRKINLQSQQITKKPNTRKNQCTAVHVGGVCNTCTASQPQLPFVHSDKTRCSPVTVTFDTPHTASHSVSAAGSFLAGLCVPML